MFRSLALTGTVLVLLPWMARFPQAGMLVWVWLSVMNPHQLVWGFAAGFGFSFWVGLVTLAAWLLSREPKLPTPGAVSALMILFTLWLVVAQLAALQPDFSFPYFDRSLRMLVLALLALALLTTKARLHALVWVYVLCIAFFSVKGGAFTLLTGGQYRVYGPDNSMIDDNNHLGLVMVSVVPLIHYLWQHSGQRWVRLGLMGTLVLTVLCVLGTYSRGAFIAGGVMLVMFWWRSRAKLQTAALALAAAVPAWFFMPQRYYERIASIGQAGEDTSFMDRVGMWELCWNIALGRPLTGAGPRGHYVQWIADHFMADPPVARAAHSVYFELLGSMGFPGLLLFLALCWASWRACAVVMRQCRDRPGLRWARDLAAMNQAGMAGFLVGGAALSMEFWPGVWLQFALAGALRAVVARHLAGQAAVARPAWRPRRVMATGA